MSKPEMREKYGAEAIDAGKALQPATFAKRLAQRDRLDQHFTKLWLNFQISGMSRRTVLDARTRLLVQIGQFTMSKAHGALEDGIRAAFDAAVAAREREVWGIAFSPANEGPLALTLDAAMTRCRRLPKTQFCLNTKELVLLQKKLNSR